MATFAKVRALPAALVLTFVLALSLAGAGAAHAAPRTTTKVAVPQNCVWTNDVTKTVLPLLENGVIDNGLGGEEAEIQTCSGTDLHRGVYAMFINSGAGEPCNTVTVDGIELYHKGIGVQHEVPPNSGQIGSRAGLCANGSEFVEVTGTFTGPNDGTYCVEAYPIFFPPSNEQLGITSADPNGNCG
jgi:hypothetical protein